MTEPAAPNASRLSRDQWRRPAPRGGAAGVRDGEPAPTWFEEPAPARAGAGVTPLAGNPRHRARTAEAPRARVAAPVPAGSPLRAGGLLASLRLVPMVAALGLAALALAGAMGLAALVDDGPAAGAGSGTLLGQPSTAIAGGAAASASDALEPPQSTPRDQWARGAVPHLYQIDEEWASVPYAGATVAESGCGPTSLSMVYVALTGRTDRDPAAMAAFSERGGYVEGGLTAWRLMTDGARELGLRSRELSADASVVRAELRAGRPVICSVGPGDFTEKGHFIVLTAVDENGDVVVHDPNSEERSLRTWDVQRVLGQCRNLWSFERA